MASGSSSRGRGSGARGRSSRDRAAEAPSADDALLAPQLNPTFVAMSAADLVAHLNCSRRSDDFVDAALVFAARERKLAEAEERIDSLLGELRARKDSALEAEDKIRRAAETEAALQAKIRTLQHGAAALISSGISGGGLAQQAAGQGREPVPQDFITASDDRVLTMFAQGRVGGDVPMKMRHGALNRAAPHLVPPLSRAAPHFVAAPPHLVGAPLPDMLVDDDERAAEQVATDIPSSNEVAQGDHEVSQDVLTTSTIALAVPVRPDESPEVEHCGSNWATFEAGPRPKRQAQPNRRFVGSEWDV